MASPFDRCSVLSITTGGASTESQSVFQAKGPLLLVLDPSGRSYSFTVVGGGLLPPEEVNVLLEKLGVDVRVDYRGVAYILEDATGGNDGRET